MLPYRVTMSFNIALMGSLFLGGFVGFVLALSLKFTKTMQLKALVAFLGAALAGAPIAFLRGEGGSGVERWMYPIGLVLGLLWIRVPMARHTKTIEPKSLAGHFAMLDMVLIAAITVVVVVATAFVKP